jgi:hypothetical protein
MKKLRKKFSKIFTKVYEREAKPFINVNNYGACFSSVTCNGKISFRFGDMMEILTFILENIYVKFGDKIFKQVIGIPIGLDSGQDIANLLLYGYESDYVEKTSKQDIVLARKFKFCFRYIDDLFVANFQTFRQHIHKIYPRELEVTLASVDCKKVSYLDLNIISENSRLTFSIYDKREDFDFEIVNFPYLDSCVPKKSAFGVFFSQLIRYARLCSKFIDFKIKSKNLSKKLQNQGFLFKDLKKLTLRFFREKQDLLINYNIRDQSTFVREILESPN